MNERGFTPEIKENGSGERGDVMQPPIVVIRFAELTRTAEDVLTTDPMTTEAEVIAAREHVVRLAGDIVRMPDISPIQPMVHALLTSEHDSKREAGLRAVREIYRQNERTHRSRRQLRQDLGLPQRRT